MARFLIEVPHESEVVSCYRAIRLLLESGSHFLTHADFGCDDGVHKAWIVVEAESKDEARNILPPSIAARRRSCNCASSDSRNAGSHEASRGASRGRIAVSHAPCRSQPTCVTVCIEVSPTAVFATDEVIEVPGADDWAFRPRP